VLITVGGERGRERPTEREKEREREACAMGLLLFSA